MVRVAIGFIVLQLMAGGVAADVDSGLAAFARGDYAAALPLLEDAANHGDIRAQATLGRMYRDGLGVAQDPGRAFPWYRKAAQAGNADAQFALGGYYLLTDRPAVVRWYRKAAAQGHAEARLRLGKMTLQGDGVPPDPAAGLRLIEAAAGQGLTDAQVELGQIHLLGKQVPADPVRALMWLLIAGEAAGQTAARLRATAIDGLAPADIDQAEKMAAAWRAARGVTGGPENP